MELRDYQIEAVNKVYDAWKHGAKNVCLQLATGGGKTACLAYIMANFPQPSIVIAHRTELVSQLSLTLAKYGVYHNIIAPKDSIQEIIRLHINEFGQSFYDPQAIRYVAGVLTLLNFKAINVLTNRIRLFVVDEAHHVLRENSWGKAIALFPHAHGLFPTATPQRADGKGLGRHSDGVIDVLVTGVSMASLIKQNYLTSYKIIAPPNDLDISEVNVTASGDYSLPKLRTAIHKSKIVGDVVKHYQRVANGKLGLTFCVDIESTREICQAYRDAGIPAEIINSKTPPLARAQIMRRFRNREILQLVNVDILGEGVDVPSVEVVSMARPTMSRNIYFQQFGRMLRPATGKTHGILIDHVNNWRRHGLPDASQIWTLDRAERRSRNTATEVPLKQCLNPECLAVYSIVHRKCPVCDFYKPPAQRRTPQQVEGDLTEIDPDVLSKMRGEVVRIDSPVRIPQGLSTIAQLGIANKHKARQETQKILRNAIAQWAGYLHANGKPDSEIHRTFYYNFNVDILTAQTLGVTEANKLTAKIQAAIDTISTTGYDT
jgi:DNA repair protein RadD